MTVYFVVPGGLDDPSRPSGGNRYDRAVCSRLPDVCEIAVPGSWPRPGDAERAALTRVLGDISEMSDVVVDGLVVDVELVDEVEVVDTDEVVEVLDEVGASGTGCQLGSSSRAGTAVGSRVTPEPSASTTK